MIPPAEPKEGVMPDPTPDPEPDPAPDPEPEPSSEPAPPPTADDLAALQKALAKERTARQVADKAAKALKAEADRRAQEAMSEQDKAVAEARKAGEAERDAHWSDRILTAEARAAAASKFADPADALAFIDRDGLVGDNGEIDTSELTSRLDVLLSEKPYLAATTKPGGPPRVPQGQHGDAPVTKGLEDMSMSEYRKARGKGKSPVP